MTNIKCYDYAQFENFFARGKCERFLGLCDLIFMRRPNSRRPICKLPHTDRPADDDDNCFPSRYAIYYIYSLKFLSRLHPLIHRRNTNIDVAVAAQKPIYADKLPALKLYVCVRYRGPERQMLHAFSFYELILT